MTELKDQVELLSIEDLIPYQNNPKAHPDDQIDKIASSIKNYGFDQPIVVDGENEIIKGHGRYRAAKKLGLEKVPVITQEDLSKAQAKAARLADNKTNESEWLDEELALEFEELEEMDFDLELTGFDEGEISATLNSQKQVEEDDFEPEINEDEEPEAEEGDIYKLGDHRLMCGDAIKEEDVKKLMNGKKADMVFTDPPYNVDYGSNKKNPSWKIRKIKGDKKTKDEWAEFNKQLSYLFQKYNKGDIYCWGAPGPDGMKQRLILTETGIHWSATIIWKKDRLVLSPAKYQRIYEPCFYGWSKKGKSSYNGNRKNVEVWETKPSKEQLLEWIEEKLRKDEDKNVWEIERPSISEEHPAMKPIELCGRAIKNSSKREDIVLDLFGGSGSTLIAAEKLNRKCHMMEIDPHYVDVIIDRWEEYTGNAVELVNGV